MGGTSLLGARLRRRTVALVMGVALVSGLAACASTPPPAVDFIATAVSHPGLPGADPEGPGVLEMPHMALRVEGVLVTDELAGHHALTLGLDREDVAATEGHEIVVVTLRAFDGSYSEGDPVATIDVGGESHDITAVAEEAAGLSGGEVALLVHVPEGETITLSVADEGRTVTMDIRSGELADDPETAAIAALYQRTPPALDGKLESEAVVGPIDDTLAAIMGTSDVWISTTASESRVRWLAWLGGEVGWAPDGEGFVAISGLTMSSYLIATPCGVGWSPADSLTLTPEGADPLAPLGTSDLDTMVELDGQLVFQVPTDVTDATLTLDPQTSVSDDCEVHEPFEPASIPVGLG